VSGSALAAKFAKTAARENTPTPIAVTFSATLVRANRSTLSRSLVVARMASGMMLTPSNGAGSFNSTLVGAAGSSTVRSIPTSSHLTIWHLFSL